MRSKSLIYGWLIFVIAASFYSYEYLLRILPGAMTADLMQAHNINTLQVGLLSSAYYFTYAFMQIPVGVCIDYFGPKRLLVIAVIACIIGSFLFSNAQAFMPAVIGRFLIGFGSAFAFVGVLRIATLWLPATQFALATGLITTVGMLGGIVGDVALGHLVDAIGWQHTVIISAYIGIPILIAIALIPNKKLPVLGAAHHCTLFDAIKGLGFVMAKPALWLNAIMGCLLYIPLSAFAELWGIPYLQTVQGLARATAVDSISWLLLGWAIGAPMMGYVGTTLQRQFKLLLLGSGLALIVILAFLQMQFMSLILLNAVLLLFGILCSGQIFIMVIAKELVPPQMAATAMAFTNMLIMLGGLVFQPLIGMLVMASSRDMIYQKLTQVDVTIYKHAMYVIPAALLMALAILLFTLSRQDLHQPTT